MRKILVVTGSDAIQFDLAASCIKSAKRQCNEDVDFAFLDLGCTDAQLGSIGQIAKFTKTVNWEYGISNSIQAIECRKGPLAKPFLREYFPDYDIYVWLDSDTWTQSPESLLLFDQGAQRRGAAFVLENHRGSKFLHGAMGSYTAFLRTLTTMTYGQSIAESMAHFAHINTGAFSLSVDSPLWDAWKHSVRTALPHLLGGKFDVQQLSFAFAMLDQVALNHAVRVNSLSHAIEFLRETCNWQCHLGLPAYDKSRDLFVEPYLPHGTISLIHLTAPWGGGVGQLPEPHLDKLRYVPPIQGHKDSYRTSELQSTDGDMVIKSLFYPDLDDVTANSMLGPIPKHLFQTSREPLPKYVTEMILGGLPLNWRYTHFDDAAMYRYLDENSSDEVPDIRPVMPMLRSGAHRADLFRYFFLYTEGGLFLDTDAMYMCDLDKIIDSHDFVSVRSSVHPGTIFNGILAASPRHPIIRDALTRACRIARGSGDFEYHAFCRDLLSVVGGFTRACRIKLLREHRLGLEGDVITDADGSVCFRHYWHSKVIPAKLRS
jgi:hypothetical protein